MSGRRTDRQCGFLVGDGSVPNECTTLERQQTESSGATELSDGTFSFTDNEFAKPGDYYLAVVRNDPYEYRSQTTVDVDDGDSLYETPSIESAVPSTTGPWIASGDTGDGADG